MLNCCPMWTLTPGFLSVMLKLYCLLFIWQQQVQISQTTDWIKARRWILFLAIDLSFHAYNYADTDQNENRPRVADLSGHRSGTDPFCTRALGWPKAIICVRIAFSFSSPYRWGWEIVRSYDRFAQCNYWTYNVLTPLGVTSPTPCNFPREPY